MNIKEYLNSLSGKTAAVLGIGVSNTPLIELLCKNGVRVIACDKKERAALGETAEKLEALGAELRLGEGYLKDIAADVIFRTPGMRPDVPELLAAKALGGVVTSEMQIFFEVCPCPIIAVSGSDGKTTTTTVISEFLREAGKKVWLGGNLGHPLLAEAEQISPDDYAVVELSSFQLLDMTRSPHIAVLTNLAPNHLDVHRDMAEYIAAKENIFRHQNSGDTAIFNLDNEITRGLSEKASAHVRLFSRLSEVSDGTFVRGGAIWSRRDGVEREVLKTAEIRIPGQHNVENYCAAIAAVDGLVADEVIRKVAREFAGVEHRIELVRVRRGVRWYNDSIASSPTRTIAGLRAFPEKVILIAGGYDKHIPFAPLAPEIVEHVKLLILCGATADAIRAALTSFEGYHGKPEILERKTLQEAVDLAAERAEKGDVVTLSPACAAFDQFKNFMERGKVFKQMVNALPE
ncbi:MAG: UDP-N-acetylmuramoyl-L-alanine--D-glutamate ligase [Oscillospiraceae bacterium]|nr:UDP-N-acetylmuramoyl-L-alanine--D-glutamate ligase [Oscillospiraceae bacterium]